MDSRRSRASSRVRSFEQLGHLLAVISLVALVMLDTVGQHPVTSAANFDLRDESYSVEVVILYRGLRIPAVVTVGSAVSGAVAFQGFLLAGRVTVDGVAGLYWIVVIADLVDIMYVRSFFVSYNSYLQIELTELPS